MKKEIMALVDELIGLIEEKLTTTLANGVEVKVKDLKPNSWDRRADHAIYNASAAIEAALDVPTVPDERSEFVAWLSTNYPHAWTVDQAEHAWRHEHVSALAWKARSTISAAPEPAQAEQPPTGFAWVNIGGRQMLERMDATVNPTVAQATGYGIPKIAPQVTGFAQAEQPRNEPVQQEPIGFYDGNKFYGSAVAASVDKADMLKLVPLYTSPQAQPMSDEQITAAVRPLYGSDEAAAMGLPDDIRIVRAVERFHKIGG